MTRTSFGSECILQLQQQQQQHNGRCGRTLYFQSEFLMKMCIRNVNASHTAYWAETSILHPSRRQLIFVGTELLIPWNEWDKCLILECISSMQSTLHLLALSFQIIHGMATHQKSITNMYGKYIMCTAKEQQVLWKSRSRIFEMRDGKKSNGKQTVKSLGK